MQDPPTNYRYAILSESLRNIDPKGLLVPGTWEHNKVTEKILSWMHVMEPEEVLKLAKRSRRFVRLNV